MPGAKKILAATAGVAAVTGLAIAARKKRKDGPAGESGGGTVRSGSSSVASGPRVYHVVPAADGWAVEVEGAVRPDSRHGTKREAVDAARDAARGAAPSRLVIHGTDGTVQRRHAYEPG
jgi:hypothetical protein